MAKLLQLFLLALTTSDGFSQLDFSAPRANLEIPLFQNLFNFQCEDFSATIPNPEYFRNGEPVSTSGNSYTINRMQEGNFSCGRSGVSESNIITLVAWPDNSIEPINRGPFRENIGSTVRLDCSITPGEVVEQYYVTWRSASDQSRVFYQSFPPHFNRSPVNIDPQHYSLDPGNFSLYIHNATPADGIVDYLCILGVTDTHPDLQNRVLIYARTESFALSVIITTAPEIIDKPGDQEVVRGDSVSFTCSVRSSPNPVNIDWLLNDTLTFNESQHYSITVEPSRTDSGYVISTSTFTINNAVGSDSSLVRCRINTGPSDQTSSAKLSVLDEVRRFAPSALQSGGYLYELELDAPLLVPVRLLFSYAEVDSGQAFNSTSQESYFGSVLIRHVASKEDVPFDKFHVQIALVYTEGRDDLIGPFFSDGREYERAGSTSETIGLIIACVVIGILLIIVTSTIFIFPCFLSAHLRTLAKVDIIANTVGKLKPSAEVDGPAGEDVERPPQEKQDRLQYDSTVVKPKKKHNGYSMKSGTKYVAALVDTIKFAQSDAVLSMLLEKNEDYQTITRVAVIELNS